MPEKSKRQRVKPGDVLSIDLGDGRFSYALVSIDPLVIFFDHVAPDDLAAKDTLALPIAFKVWVFRADLGSGRWPRIGRVAVPAEWLEQPMTFQQDLISGKLSLHHAQFADSNYERPATLLECSGLERAAVWSAVHVEDRLRDHYAGVPNQWLNSMAIDISRVPVAQRD